MLRGRREDEFRPRKPDSPKRLLTPDFSAGFSGGLIKAGPGSHTIMIDKGNYERAAMIHGKCLLTYHYEQAERSGGISDTFENIANNLEESTLHYLDTLRAYASNEALSSFCGTVPGEKVTLPQ